MVVARDVVAQSSAVEVGKCGGMRLAWVAEREAGENASKKRTGAMRAMRSKIGNEDCEQRRGTSEGCTQTASEGCSAVRERVMWLINSNKGSNRGMQAIGANEVCMQG